MHLGLLYGKKKKKKPTQMELPRQMGRTCRVASGAGLSPFPLSISSDLSIVFHADAGQTAEEAVINSLGRQERAARCVWASPS